MLDTLFILMAENKKSFVLYADLIHTVKKMPDDKAGQLLKIILSYVNDENPVVDDLLIDLVFEPIKRQMKRDLVKYESKKTQWSEAGKKSAEAKKLQKELNGRSTESTDVDNRSTESTVTVNDTVNVNVTVNDTDIKSNINTVTPSSDDVSLLFDKVLTFWNSLDIIKHKTISEKSKPILLKLVKPDGGVKFKTICTRYNKALKDNDYFFSYKWTLEEFITRKDGYSSFEDEGSKWVNYKEVTKQEAPKHKIDPKLLEQLRATGGIQTHNNRR